MASLQNPVGCDDELIFKGAEEVKGDMEPPEGTRWTHTGETRKSPGQKRRQEAEQWRKETQLSYGTSALAAQHALPHFGALEGNRGNCMHAPKALCPLTILNDSRFPRELCALQRVQ